jgi:hypothetical protein
MAIVCCKCGYVGPRGVIVFSDSGGSREYCRVCKPSNNITPALNPFQDFTLQHVKDERGQKVKVNSLSELRAAEKRYNFALAVATDDGGTADKPPQHELHAGDITHGKPRIWNRDPSAYERPAGVSTGVAADSAETLVGRPNATHV